MANGIYKNDSMEVSTTGSGQTLSGYAKFSSGLLICFGGIASYSTTESEKTIPITFAHVFSGNGAFTLSLGMANNAAGNYDNAKISYYEQTKTGFTARAINTTATRLASGFYIAIGTWK